jgi:hypothetical protein
MIETSANLDASTYERIIAAANDNQIHVRHIVHVLFKRMLLDIPLKNKVFSRVKYQERISGRKWKLFRLRLSEAMYEGCVDMRKLHKMSVSFILDVAVDLYLDRAIAELKGVCIDEEMNPDNYMDFYGLIRITTPKASFFTALHLPPAPETIYINEH